MVVMRRTNDGKRRAAAAFGVLACMAQSSLVRAETPSSWCDPNTIHLPQDNRCVKCLDLLSQEDENNVAFTTKPTDVNLRVPLILPEELRSADSKLDQLLKIEGLVAGEDERHEGALILTNGEVDFSLPLPIGFTPPLVPGSATVRLSFPDEYECDSQDIDQDGDTASYGLTVHTLPQTVDDIIERLEIVPGRLAEVVNVESACCPVEAEDCTGTECFQCWERVTIDHAYFKWTEPGSYYVDVEFSFADEQARPSVYAPGLVVFESARPACAVASISAAETTLTRNMDVCIPEEFQGLRNPDAVPQGTLEVEPSSCLVPPEGSNSYFNIARSLHVVRAPTEQEALDILNPPQPGLHPNNPTVESGSDDEQGNSCSWTPVQAHRGDGNWLWGTLVLTALAVGRRGRARVIAPPPATQKNPRDC